MVPRTMPNAPQPRRVSEDSVDFMEHSALREALSPQANKEPLPTSDELHAAAIREAVAKLNELVAAANSAGLMIEFDEHEHSITDHRGYTRYTRLDVTIAKSL